MKLKNLALFAFIGSAFCAQAQKGNNGLQVSGQAALPVGKLTDVVHSGFGGAAKGMYGFGSSALQSTLEVGYNRFSVRNLPSSITAHYSAIPVYTGFRATVLGGVVFETQAGVSFNRVEGTGPAGTASGNQTAFGWAVSAGYAFKNVELEGRYQNSESDDDDYVIRFIGLRLGYNFSL